MAADRFFIAPFDKESGEQTNVKPWLIPDEAFAELTNAYVFRGRVRKRFGSRWLGNDQLSSRFRINVGTTDGGGNLAASVPVSGGAPIATPAIGQMFSIGAEVFTVNVLGNPANLLISGATVAATFDTTTGAFSFTGATINTIVYYYPSLPVMGLQTYEANNVNEEVIVGFDTRFAYRYVNGWERLATETAPGDAFWTGSNAQFFWTTTWTGVNAAAKIFFVTNFNENEPRSMRSFDGVTWSQFMPAVTGAEFLISARIIVPFKNRLIAFNTWEGAAFPGTNYPNRARYSQIGSPLAADAFRQDIAGKGNAIDCPTTEAIVTVEFVKDRLIVFFERSTWELVYIGNQAYPFTWQQINTELGAESTFSIVPFDKVAIGVGNVGIHACNGANVERIDEKIPDAIFRIHNNDDGIQRVYGIRDYFVEMIYWTLPDVTRTSSQPYPNQVLVFNYQTGTWAFNIDSITCFGYIYNTASTAITWDSAVVTWDDPVSWDSGTLQVNFRQVIAGNQEGYTFIIDSEETTNAAVLQITDIAIVANVVTITCVDHNMQEGDYIYLQDIIGTGNLNLLNDSIFEITLITQNTFSFTFDDGLGTILAGVYAGNGTISRVSNISITTKEYNFYASKGRNAYVSKVDFLVDKTDAGQIDVDYFISTSLNSMISSGTGSLLGTTTLDTFPYPSIPFEADASRLWHPVYFQADGECVQLNIAMNDEQLRDVDIREADFQLHAMVFYAQPSSTRLQ